MKCESIRNHAAARQRRKRPRDRKARALKMGNAAKMKNGHRDLFLGALNGDDPLLILPIFIIRPDAVIATYGVI